MKSPWIFMVLLGVELACAFFFLWQIAGPLLGLQSRPVSWQLYELIEIGAALGLIVGVGATGYLLRRALRGQHHAEEQLKLASGAFMEVLEQHFSDWSLTPAERDVAFFAIKGLSTADIARLRGTSEGTIKAQTNAIYRKAGVSGRPQLLSLFIDTLMAGELPQIAEPKPALHALTERDQSA